MKYTVIVPVFNAEDTIESCIKSLVNQDHAVYGKDYAILVVDDGSTDRTAEILSRLPVPVIRLPKNEGRIVARLTGAKSAKTEKILFVDARIAVPNDMVSKLGDFGRYPAVIGELDAEGGKYETVLSTVLYLIRRKYYGKENFPMQADELLITEKNFKRAPKGTAVLLIERELFIRLTPERTGKNVNDDTLLFHQLVFQHGISLLRSRKLLFKYSQRTDFKQFSSWLFHRGVRFSDFYLRPGGYFFGLFLLALSGLLLTLICTVISLSISPWNLLYIISFACVLNGMFSIYLSENGRDLLRTIQGLPLILLIFGAGIVRFWFSSLGAMLKTKLGHSA
jgi:glycosyltransferase involved in cell wall biosynthesis